MREHISDKNVDEKIMDWNPVPTNIKEVPVLDPLNKNKLMTSGKSLTLKHEKTLKNIQSQILNILGPLCKVWTLVEAERAAEGELEDLVDLCSFLTRSFFYLVRHTIRPLTIAGKTFYQLLSPTP